MKKPDVWIFQDSIQKLFEEKKGDVRIIVAEGKAILGDDTTPAVQNPTISDLMNELSRLDPAAWTERTIGYEVVK